MIIKIPNETEFTQAVLSSFVQKTNSKYLSHKLIPLSLLCLSISNEGFKKASLKQLLLDPMCHKEINSCLQVACAMLNYSVGHMLCSGYKHWLYHSLKELTHLCDTD